MSTSGKNRASEQLVTEILQRITELNRHLPQAADPALLTSAAQLIPETAPASPLAARSPSVESTPDEIVAQLDPLLKAMGILPAYAGHILETLSAAIYEGSSRPPHSARAQIANLLRSWWRPGRPGGSALNECHVFVGPAGAGKTTVLSKWLAQAVLLGGKSAHVWRLDGCTANTAEALTVYSDVLGVPVMRAWPAEMAPVDFQFFDFPGVDWRDPGALTSKADRVRALGDTHVHLVLNAAYDTSVLLDQLRAFASCPVTDMIFTHLDEERNWGKLWNFVIASRLPIRFLAGGQNVPGHFREATPELLLTGGLD
ncbi:MAG: flagellar biosynthesis protein FlhF [Verrucomicrobiota bacterium]|jgi:signal recognition particle GTPase